MSSSSSARANGCCSHLNGLEDHLISSSGQNGALSLSHLETDLIRIIGQYLSSLGLQRATEALIEESGCTLDHPTAAMFRKHIMEGDFIQAIDDLQQLRNFVDREWDLVEMKFLILQQRYMEYLEEGKVMEALLTLRNELTPLQHNTERVHILSGYLMISGRDELIQRTGWSGKNGGSRDKLLDHLQEFLPPNVMLPPNRLLNLMAQAQKYQLSQCLFHNKKEEEGLERRLDMPLTSHRLLVDHACPKESFPSKTKQVLSEHCDEIWYCDFSPDGKKLATGSKDNSIIIWDVNLETYSCTRLKTLDGHTYGVAFLSWSPDSQKLLACGPEDCPEFYIYDMDSLNEMLKVSHSGEDSLNACAWHRDGKRFVIGGSRGQFYLCGDKGNIITSWEGIRVVSLWCRSDGNEVLVTDSHCRMRACNFESMTDTVLFKEDHPIISFSVNYADTLAILNVATQGVNMWDLRSKSLVRRFRGVTQGHFMIHSCFGGVNESFIASGSEDHKVYVWNVDREEPVAILTGHTRTVNTISWNAANPAMLASVSDDHNIHIWGPDFRNDGEMLDQGEEFDIGENGEADSMDT